MQRIGVLGASFNPPTLGHRDVVEQVLPHFDEILLVPSLSHPFHKPLMTIMHRLEMLRIFVEQWQEDEVNNKVKIFNIEAVIQKAHLKEGPIYTYEVLATLQELYQSYGKPFQIQFIIGPDNAKPSVWHQFYRYQEIEQNWPLFIVEEKISIRSTMVREVIAKQTSEEKVYQELSALVGPPIAHYILQHHLYTQKEYASE